MNSNPILENQMGRAGRSKIKSFTRRQFRVRLDAVRETRREQEKTNKANRRRSQPYD